MIIFGYIGINKNVLLKLSFTYLLLSTDVATRIFKIQMRFVVCFSWTG